MSSQGKTQRREEKFFFFFKQPHIPFLRSRKRRLVWGIVFIYKCTEEIEKLLEYSYLLIVSTNTAVAVHMARCGSAKAEHNADPDN